MRVSYLNDLKELSIIYAEDDELLRESTAKTLGLLFGQVFTATNGVEAMSLLNKYPNIHIAMLDIKMGTMSGIEVAKEIRKKNKEMPIFLVSSYTEVKDLIAACKLNLVDYIQKPFTFQILTKTFKECVDRLKSNGSLMRKVSDTIFYDPSSRILVKNGVEITMTKNEIDALELLLSKRGQVITYETFINLLGCSSDAGIKNMMLRLRKKVGDELIRNLSKVGYTLI